MSVDTDSQWHTLPSVLWESNMASKTCRRCCKDWSPLLRWRHHCRFCGQLVCDNCSAPRESYAHIQKPARTCWPCSALIRALLMEEAHHWEFYEQLEEQTQSRGDSPSTIADEAVDKQLARMPTCCDIVTADLGDLDAAGDSTDNSFSLETPTKQHRIMLEEFGSPIRTSGFAEGKASDAAGVPETPPPQDISKPVSFYRSPMAADSPKAGTEVTTPWSEVTAAEAAVTPSSAETEGQTETKADCEASSEVTTPWSVLVVEGLTPSTLGRVGAAEASPEKPDEVKEVIAEASEEGEQRDVTASELAEETEVVKEAVIAEEALVATETPDADAAVAETAGGGDAGGAADLTEVANGAEGASEAAEGADAAEASQEGPKEDTSATELTEAAEVAEGSVVMPEEATSAPPVGKEEATTASDMPAQTQKKNKKKNKGK